MFSTCLHCTKSLGTNEAIETLPIGRRVAFDAAQGRLWVVCRHCAKWNLVPFDTRLESIDACERLYRDTRTRYATDNIGLARVKEGLELVRIGEPLRPEFASWRYGDSFGKRRRRNLLVGGAAIAGVGAVFAGASALGIGTAFAPHLINLVNLRTLGNRPVVRVPGDDGLPIELAETMIPEVRVIKDPDTGWALRTKVLQPARARRKWFRSATAVEEVIRGAEAERLLASTLARRNRYDGTPRQLREAVELVESRGELSRLVIGGGMPTREGSGARKLLNLPARWRLAVEMALHEEREREALAGELKLLEWEWREAERLAKVADTLAIPPEVSDQLAERKGES